MKKSTTNFIEDLLRDYPRIPAYIERKKQDIKYPYKANNDNNVGGGQGHSRNTSPTERIVLKIDDCDFINAFLDQETAISDALNKCEPEFVKVIEEYYFNAYNHESIRKIGLDHGYANHNLYNQRTRLFKNIMRNLGMHHFIERDSFLNERNNKINS